MPTPFKMKYFLTCPPGFEDVAAKEVEEKFGLQVQQKPFGFNGHLLVEGDRLDVFSLRSIYNAYLYLGQFSFESLDDLACKLAELDLSEFAHGKFRVTSRRIGEHPFTSLDIQAKAGDVIRRKYNLTVDLKNFDVEFEVDVIENRFWVGVKLNKESLAKRPYKVVHHPAELGAPIAYCMIRKIPIKECFLDAMTGSGTLAIERWFFVQEKGAQEQILAIDRNPKFVEFAKQNAAAAMAQIELKQYNAARLYELGQFDAIVANPPYGRRLRGQSLKNLYESLFAAVSRALNRDGIFALITLRIALARKLAAKYDFNILDFRRVEHGGLFPGVFYFTKGSAKLL